MSSPDEKTGVILLAAGQGTRFGGGKLTADFRGRPLWEWAAEAADNVTFDQRILVIGPHSTITGRPGWRLVENTIAHRGMGTSIAAGIRALTDCDQVVVMLADMPLVSTTHILRILASRGVSFTRYSDGKAGCPAAFPQSDFDRLMSLTGDQGARILDLEDVALVGPVNEGELADIDEVYDLERLKSFYRGQIARV